MRELKFRGKSLNTGSWVIANSVDISDGDVWIDSIRVDAETVGQFTGMKDIMGKEIYEGDIVQLEDPERELTKDDGAPFIEVVMWQDSMWVSTEKEGNYQEQSIEREMKEHWHFTVIGNIHDDKELLNRE